MFIYKVIIVASKGRPMETLGKMDFPNKPTKDKPFTIRVPGQIKPLDIEVELIAIIKQGRAETIYVRRHLDSTEVEANPQPNHNEMWDNKMKSIGRIAGNGFRCPVTFI